MVAAAMVIAASGAAGAGAPWVSPRPTLRAAPAMLPASTARPVHRRVTLVSVTYGASYRPPLRPAALTAGAAGVGTP
ncbi:MAG: hypothetical protein D6688_03980, partial [Alphaproteobacteria bacterium]